MSQNISEKESWFHPFLQTEREIKVGDWHVTTLGLRTRIRFAWCESPLRVRVPDTPDSDHILARNECGAFGDQGILHDNNQFN